MKDKLKRYSILITVETLLVSLLIALFGGFLSEGILYFVFKMTNYEMELIYRLLIDGGIALLLFAASFLLLFKNKKKRAKILDKELDLKEKIATMYELENDPSEMARIQREEALQSVERKGKNAFRLRIKTVPLVLAAAAILICGVSHVLPYPTVKIDADAKEEQTLPGEGGSNITDSNIQEIIDNLQSSDILPDDLHKDILDILEELDKNLSEAENNEQRDQAIQEAIDQLEDEEEEIIQGVMGDQFMDGPTDKIEQILNELIEDLKSMMMNNIGELPVDKEGIIPEHNAGMGSGEMNFGADEVLYDPETNTEVTYGELLSYYYGLINATMTEEDVPDELEKMIYTYFGYLFYGEETTEETENKTQGEEA